LSFYILEGPLKEKNTELQHYPITAMLCKTLEIFWRLNPAVDFAFRHAPDSDVGTKGLKNGHRIRSHNSPFEFQLVDDYIDLEIAIYRGDWDTAYRIARHLSIMLDG
jgi:hypothetical protein